MARPMYPLIMPDTGNKPATISLALNKNSGLYENPTSGHQQVYEYDYNIITGVIKLPTMEAPQIDEWVLFFNKLEGMAGQFMFDFNYVNNKMAGNGVTHRVNQVGQYTVGCILDPNTPGVGANAGSLGELTKGQWISIGAGALARLYQIDVNAAGNLPVFNPATGSTTLHIYPRLKIPVPQGAPIKFIGPGSSFRLNSNMSKWDQTRAKTFETSFAIREVKDL